MKIITYNVNGIRAAINKGFLEWLALNNFDIVCLQEIKAEEPQINVDALNNLGYSCYFNSAQKKGYSGVGILTKIKPNNIEYGCGIPFIDTEGRILRADFENFSIMSVYMPSGSSGEERQAVKMQFLNHFLPYSKNLLINKPNLIISGDYNICHQAIDIHDPVSNKNSSGFLPEERAWMDSFFNAGFVDAYRVVEPTAKHQYSWWSFRANARHNNKGWRIDYNAISLPLSSKIIASENLMQVTFSDHCPVLLELN